MKTLKIIVAISVTVALFFASRNVIKSEQNLIEYRTRSGAYELIHITEGYHAGTDTSPLFSVKVSGPLSGNTIKATLINFAPYPTGLMIPVDTIRSPMKLADDARDEYEVTIQPLEAGDSIAYLIQVEDTSGALIGTIPSGEASAGRLLSFRFEGIAPVWLVVLVVGFLSAAMFTATLALFSASSFSWYKPFTDTLGKEALWTAVFLVLGGGIFSGMLSNRITATVWDGWPFGVTNLADTATEFAALSWLALAILLKGSAFGSLSKNNIMPASRARILMLVCYPLTVLAYLAARKLPL